MANYQICNNCVMDTTDHDIVFDGNGVCNYCNDFESIKPAIPAYQADGEEKLKKILDNIKTEGKYKEYDCLLGVSGGVDSSYVAHLTSVYGLRPLVVHFDNGWNSELAVSNIQKLIDSLGYDLTTYVIDWEEFRDLQKAFLKASVVDIEMLTDHAIAAATLKFAKDHKIKYILIGRNAATEFGMPKSWNWSKSDSTNIKAIHKQFGEVKLSSFPFLGTFRKSLLTYTGKYVYVDILDYIPYKKSTAIKELGDRYGWKYYGGKHYESVFTKFYQAYILPEKFGIDKRRAHLSSLIRNSEISRSEALEELKKPLYAENELVNEKEYVLKKLGLSEQEFDDIMAKPPVAHDSYRSNRKLVKIAVSIFKKLTKK